MSLQVLTLLSGTQLVLGKSQSLILPEDYSYLREGDNVLLENEQREHLGTATVEKAELRNFAHLQQYHFAQSAHMGLTSWGVAADAMKELVPEFSIVDPVTVIWIEPTTLFEPSLSVGAPKPVVEETTAPPVEEQLADLANVATGEGQ
jgi:hypothetical protein